MSGAGFSWTGCPQEPIKCVGVQYKWPQPSIQDYSLFNPRSIYSLHITETSIIDLDVHSYARILDFSWITIGKLVSDDV